MRILLAESDQDLAEEVCRIAGRRATVSRLCSRDYADLEVPAADRVAIILGSLVEVDDGLDAAALIRRRDTRLPILVLRRAVDAPTLNLAQALRCELVCTPFHARNILGFVEDAVEKYLLGQTLRGAWEELLIAYGFSRRESELMEACTYRSVPRDVCAELGISYSTYRTMRARMLKKSGVDSFETLCGLFRRSVAAEVSRASHRAVG